MDERLTDREWLLSAYADGRTLDSLAKELNVARETLRRRLVEHGAAIRTRSEAMKGIAKSSTAKSRMSEARKRYWEKKQDRLVFRIKVSRAKLQGRSPAIGDLGYRRVIDLSESRGGILEHRQVMGEAIGRKLLRCETVHHKDGDRANNALGNLELWSSYHPSGQRVRDKIAWAKEIVCLYGDLPDEIL